MEKRSSVVQRIHVNSIQLGSVLEIGDSKQIVGKSNVVAVQREKEVFYGLEDRLLTLSIPTPIQAQHLTPPLVIRTYNDIRHINVDSIAIKGISASGIVQIGNTEQVNMHSFVFHIRHLTNNRYY